MNDFIKEAHSGLRWLVLVLLLVSIVMGFLSASQNKPYKKGLYAATMGFLHIQVILGIILLVQNKLSVFDTMSFGEVMKNAGLRADIVEHPTMMLLAAIVATVGYSSGKRAATDAQKHKKTAIFYSIALVLIFLGIQRITGTFY